MLTDSESLPSLNIEVLIRSSRLCWNMLKYSRHILLSRITYKAKFCKARFLISGSSIANEGPMKLPSSYPTPGSFKDGLQVLKRLAVTVKALT